MKITLTNLTFAPLILIMLVSCNEKKDHSHKPVIQPEVTANVPSPGTNVTDSPDTSKDVEVTLGELRCIDRGGYLTGCTMDTKVLAEKQAVLSMFELTYSFNCVGHELAINILFEGIEIPLKPSEESKIILRGFGPFELTDIDPEWSRSARLKKEGCALEIKEFSTSPI